jgi:CHAT domain-containing protein
VTIQPEAPGSAPLPYARRELQTLQNIFPKENLVALGTKDAPASVESVLSHLSDAYIAHFACHGDISMTSPLESCLILHDGEKLMVSELMKTPMSMGSLVFLCACNTATGTEDLPDESVHLAGSLLFAGFRGAVATMW